MFKTRKNLQFFVSRNAQKSEIFGTQKSQSDFSRFYKFSRKSQAALEFLTTYAWAFLVILIMIGALAYFGILNPSSLLPDRCNFGSAVGCTDYQLGLTTLNLRLKNGVGEPIVIENPVSNITLSSESVTDYACTLTTMDGVAGTSPYTWDTGDVIDIIWASCNGAAVGFVDGEKGKVSITILYHLAKSSTTYTHEVTGEVFATIT